MTQLNHEWSLQIIGQLNTAMSGGGGGGGGGCGGVGRVGGGGGSLTPKPSF